jgi:hypothetical protein
VVGQGLPRSLPGGLVAFTHVSLGKVEAGAWVPSSLSTLLYLRTVGCLHAVLSMTWGFLGTKALLDAFLVCPSSLSHIMDRGHAEWMGAWINASILSVYVSCVGIILPFSRWGGWGEQKRKTLEAEERSQMLLAQT